MRESACPSSAAEWAFPQGALAPNPPQELPLQPREAVNTPVAKGAGSPQRGGPAELGLEEWHRDWSGRCQGAGRALGKEQSDPQGTVLVPVLPDRVPLLSHGSSPLPPPSPCAPSLAWVSLSRGAVREGGRGNGSSTRASPSPPRLGASVGSGSAGPASPAVLSRGAGRQRRGENTPAPGQALCISHLGTGSTPGRHAVLETTSCLKEGTGVGSLVKD